MAAVECFAWDAQILLAPCKISFVSESNSLRNELKLEQSFRGNLLIIAKHKNRRSMHVNLKSDLLDLQTFMILKFKITKITNNKS